MDAFSFEVSRRGPSSGYMELQNMFSEVKPVLSLQEDMLVLTDIGSLCSNLGIISFGSIFDGSLRNRRVSICTVGKFWKGFPRSQGGR